jgi:hypothetical protein
VTLGVSLEVLLALTFVGALWFQRRRALARARWRALVSGAQEHSRTLFVVARGAPPPEPGLAVVAGCDSPEELVQYVRRSDFFDRVLLWPAPATEDPVRFLLIPLEAEAATATRLRHALAVSPEEAARPPAMRAHHERAAHRDLAALSPLAVALGASVLLLVLVLVDPFAEAAPPAGPAPAERICAEATTWCESAARVQRLVEKSDCEEAAQEMRRLAAAFIGAPESARTDTLERALNDLDDRVRRCAPGAKG